MMVKQKHQQFMSKSGENMVFYKNYVGKAGKIFQNMPILPPVTSTLSSLSVFNPLLLKVHVGASHTVLCKWK